MAAKDQFSIEAKLKITGVDVKGDLNAGTLKFKVDTSALKKLVSDAGEAAKRVKVKFDNIKLNKLKIAVSKTSLRSVESQIRKAVQNAVKTTKLNIQASVTGGTKTDPFKTQRLAAGKSARSLTTLHELTKQVNTGLRSMIRTLGTVGQKGVAGPGQPKGTLPFPPGAQTVGVGSLGGGGGGGGRRGGPGAAPGGPGRGAGGVTDVANATKQLTDNTKNANKEMIDLEELTFQVGKKAAAFRGVAIAINTVVTAAQAAAKFIIEFNDSLIEVNKILQLTDGSLQKLGDELFGLSAKTGVAVDETIKISEAFARAGLSGRGYGSITELTNRALTGLQGTTLDASQATELFIQVLQQVEGGVRGLNKELITTTKLFDVLGKAEDITASKATDVQAAFKRSAASIFATGVTIEQATTLISVLQERTQRGGDVIGTALKTLASRISSSTSEATKALNAIGVATIDQQGNLRNLFDVLQDTAIAFKSLTEAEQANVAVKTAGIRQVEVFRAAVQNFNRMQTVNTALVNASGDATRKQIAEQKKLSVVLNKLQIAFQQLVKTASEGIIGEAFVFAITIVEKLFTAISNLDKGIGGALSTFTGLLTVGLGLKILIPMLIGIGRAIKFFIGFQKESAVAMAGIKQGGDAIAGTVSGKMNPALQMTAQLTAQAATGMGALGAATTQAAMAAERLAVATTGAAGRAVDPRLAGGNIGRGGVDIIQTGGKAGGAAFLASQKKVGKFGKVVGGVTRGFKSLGKNIIGMSLIATLAGGALQSFSEQLRKAGDARGATAADIAGGVIGGVGQGALIGSLIAPGIGTAIGAVLGGISGAVPALIRAFDGAGDSTEDLTQQMVRLGIVQAENGEITSEVAAQVDKALRDIQGFKTFTVGVAARERQEKEDPKAAVVNARKLEEARIQAQKSVLASFDPTASIDEQNKLFFQALNAPLRERGGDKQFDLGSVLFEKGIADLDKETINAINEELSILVDALGGSGDTLRQQLQAQVDLAKALNTTQFEVKEATKVADKRIKDFVDALPSFLPPSEQITPEAEKAAEDFRAALIKLANGVIKITNKDIKLGLAFAQKEGFRTEEGELLQGGRGVNAARAKAEQADLARQQRQQVGVAGIAAAGKPIREISGQAILEAVTTGNIAKRLASLAQKEETLLAVFEGLSQTPPQGDIVGDAVSKLDLSLRDFIADFGRQITKLNETRLKALTPQIQLADAMAENAQAILAASQKTIAVGGVTARKEAGQELSKIGARGKRVNQDLNDIIADLGFFEDFAVDIDKRLTESNRTIQQLINRGDIPEIAEVFGTSEAGAKEVLKAGRKTADTVMDAFLNNLIKAGQEAAARGVIDPDELARIFEQVGEATPDLAKTVKVKDQQKIVNIAKKFLETSTKLTTEGYSKIIKANAALLNSLKTRLAEEARAMAIDKGRRAAAAMNARVAVEELTGIRRLVAARRIEQQVIEDDIAAQEERLNTIDRLLSEQKALTQTEKNRGGILTRINILEQERAKEEVRLSKLVATARMGDMREILRTSKLMIAESKKVGSQERKRISTLADINSLLSIDRTSMQKFNAELATIGAQFKTVQAEFATEAAEVRKIEDPEERKTREVELEKRATAAALEHAKAEAQVIAKRREAVKQIAEELLGNQQQQVDAQKAIIDATKGVSDAFENYLQAVDGAIMATTRYNLGLQLASVAATKVTGGFTGLTGEIGAVQDTFREAERLARDMGASEKTLVSIRRESINQQLAMFNQLLADQTQAARSFFTSSAQDQADLFQGIQEAQGIAELLGGSFDEFKKKGDSAINDLGAQILALPQESRQRIQEALDVLRTTGGTIAGFTADQLQTALDEAVFGRSTEGGPLEVDSIIQVQEKIAALTEEQAKLATEELIAANEGVVAAKEQLEVAQASKDLAEIQLERIKEEGDKLRGKLGELQGQLHTTLLQQEQTARLGFQSVTTAVARAANDMVTKLPDAFSVKIAESLRELVRSGAAVGGPRGDTFTSQSRPTAKTRGKEQADMTRELGRDRAAAQQRFSQGGNGVAIPVDASAGATTGRGSNNPNDPGVAQTNRKLQDILSQLQDLNTTSDANLEATQDIVNNTGTTIGTAAAVVGGGGQPDITINIEGTSTVTVTGFEAGVTRIAQALATTFGGFATEEEARQIANEVVENIRRELLRRNIITPTTL